MSRTWAAEAARQAGRIQRGNCQRTAPPRRARSHRRPPTVAPAAPVAPTAVSGRSLRDSAKSPRRWGKHDDASIPAKVYDTSGVLTVHITSWRCNKRECRAIYHGNFVWKGGKKVKKAKKLKRGKKKKGGKKLKKAKKKSRKKRKRRL